MHAYLFMHSPLSTVSQAWIPYLENGVTAVGWVFQYPLTDKPRGQFDLGNPSLRLPSR